MTTQFIPPSLAPKTAHRTSLGHRIPSPLLNRRLAFPTLALLALLTASLLFLLPGGPAWAQSAETIEYAENGTGSVATYTATDPEGTAIASWSLAWHRRRQPSRLRAAC